MYTALDHSYTHRRFQTRASPGIAQVKFWSIVCLLLTTILSCGTMGAELSDSNGTTELGGGTGFFSTHKLTARITCISCPGYLAALKPPLVTQ